MTKLFPGLTLLSQSAQQIILQLDIDADIHWFDGHFPDAPVLPGVTQLDWAVHYSRQYFPQLAQVQAVEVLKFQHMIRPGQQLQLVLDYRAESTTLFSYSRSGEKVASGRLKWSLATDA
jgi:3-hydroxymyristoyl/3-hydroxydecanoyl-(acyl carrier protein) dehydratase